MKEFDPRTERVRERNRMALEMIEGQGIAYNDLFGYVENRVEYYAGGDGVHLVAEGKTALARKVADEIEKALSKDL